MIEGLGVRRVGLGDLEEVRERCLGVALMEVDEAAVVGRPDVRRVDFENPVEDGLGGLFIALLLAVHGGDGEVDLDVEVVGVACCELCEDLARRLAMALGIEPRARTASVPRN